jgi:hypothetical protein
MDKLCRTGKSVLDRLLVIVTGLMKVFYDRVVLWDRARSWSR